MDPRRRNATRVMSLLAVIFLYVGGISFAPKVIGFEVDRTLSSAMAMPIGMNGFAMLLLGMLILSLRDSA